MQVIRPTLDASGQRFALVVSRYHESITERLVQGALDTIVRHGGDENRITEVVVPGAWEIPLAAKWIATQGRHDAIICLGCVIRGETPHFEYVARAAADGALRVSLDAGMPVTFGVITAESLEQALARAGGRIGNKGGEAALAAIELLALRRSLEPK